MNECCNICGKESTIYCDDCGSPLCPSHIIEIMGNFGGIDGWEPQVVSTVCDECNESS